MLTSTVQNDAGYKMVYEVNPDGPHPLRYAYQGLQVSYDRVPETEREDLYRLAWHAWNERRSGDPNDD